MLDTQDLLAVKAVYDAIGILYNHFGDPLSDRDPHLVQGMEHLQQYCMSKQDELIAVQKNSRQKENF